MDFFVTDAPKTPPCSPIAAPAECPAIPVVMPPPPAARVFFGRIYQTKYWANCESEEDFSQHIGGIITHHKKREHGRTNSLPGNSLLSEEKRGAMVDLLTLIAFKNGLVAETLYTSVYLLDSYLQHSGSMKSVINQDLGNAVLACAFIAAKTEEVEYQGVSDFALFGVRNWKWGWATFNRMAVLEMEPKILQDCKWDAWMPQPLEFLRMYNSLVPASMVGDESYILSRYLLDCSLLYAGLLEFAPSLRAASAIHASRVMCHLDPDWPAEYAKVTGYETHSVLVVSLKLGFIYCLEKLSVPSHAAFEAYKQPANFCVATKYNFFYAKGESAPPVQGEGYTPPAVDQLSMKSSI
jgi:hypothetical protein